MLDIEAIKSEHDLREIVGETHTGFIDHKGELIILCPFHQERTPSCRVNNKRFHCFGCGERGDVFNWYAKIAGLSFKEVLKRLADDRTPELKLRPKPRAFSEIDCEQRLKDWEIYWKYWGEVSGQVPAIVTAKENLYPNLTLGYASGNWPESFGNLSVLNNRMIIPIFDTSSNLVAFSSRAIDDRKPKYLHLPSNSHWQKSRILWGRHLWKERGDTLYITEGFWDTCAIIEEGFASLCCMGTSISPSQINLIQYLAFTHVIIAFDGDNAGYRGMSKAGKLLQEAGINVSLLNVPQGQEPETFNVRHSSTFTCSHLYTLGPNLGHFFHRPGMIDDKIDLTEIQEVFRPYIKKNIEDGLAYYNILDFAADAAKEEQRMALIAACNAINAGPHKPTQESIQGLLKAWKTICREARIY